MSKKDQKRYEEEGTIHRGGKLVKEAICAFPMCRNHVSPQSKFGLCQTCDYVINLVAWFDKAMAEVDKVREEGPTILVPRPGMEDKAIAEALQKARAEGKKGIAVIGRRQP